MEIIKPSFEIWKQEYKSPIEDMYNHIARCTRVCYQSEKKDNNETEEEFVKRILLRHEPANSEANHLAMLEHGTIYLTLNEPSYINNFYTHNKYSHVVLDYANNLCHVTTNFRVIIEHNRLSDLQYVVPPTKYHARRITVSFITNIGVTREFNRHRVNSIAEESTRYCNYNKRNNGEIKYVVPAWWSAPVGIVSEINIYNDTAKIGNTVYNCSKREIAYLHALQSSEFVYNQLILCGWKPQQAREVLPLATKTQLIHTAFVDDWKHFFKLRAEGISGPPHPNAEAIASPLYCKFKENNLL